MKHQTDHSDSTPLLQDWLGDDKAKRHRREIHFPTGRFGEAIEQAQAVVFLASDESSFVNATDFVVDGGLTKVRTELCLMKLHLLTVRL
jgi:NAD(P)-dependent dehydrogenase (short-subunit alcohol dehydrogenase family)